MDEETDEEMFGTWIASKIRTLEEQDRHLNATIAGVRERRASLQQQIQSIQAVRQMYLEDSQDSAAPS